MNEDHVAVVRSGDDTILRYPRSGLDVRISSDRSNLCSDKSTLKMKSPFFTSDRNLGMRSVDFNWNLDGDEVGKRIIDFWPRPKSRFLQFGAEISTQFASVVFVRGARRLVKIGASNQIWEIDALTPPEALWVTACLICENDNLHKLPLLPLVDILNPRPGQRARIPRSPWRYQWQWG